MPELSVYGCGVATTDAELRQVGDNGNCVCSVNLAFNRSYKDAEGKYQQESCFIKVTMWGKRAEKMADLVKKGRLVSVTGYLKQEKWTTKEGVNRTAHVLMARDFQMCEKFKRADSVPDENGAVDNGKKEAAATASNVPVLDDDVPF